MKLEICKKCPLWSEYVMVTYPNDLSWHKREGVVGMGCCALDLSARAVVHGEELDRMKKVLRGNGTTYVGFGEGGYEYVSSQFGKQLGAVARRMVAKKVGHSCMFYAEQQMEEWNA